MVKPSGRIFRVSSSKRSLIERHRRRNDALDADGIELREFFSSRGSVVVRRLANVDSGTSRSCDPVM
jgi:hypothetical protein